MSLAVAAEIDFALDRDFRDRLDRTAREYYDAKEVDDDDRATDAFRTLHGGRALGDGSGRVVIPLDEWNFSGGHYDEYVIKLATPFPHEQKWGGLAQNQREAELWRETESEHLVPVVASDPDNYWLVMPRGEDSKRCPPAEFYEWKRTAKFDLGGAVWREDLNWGNTVILRDEFRLCDYGVSGGT